MQSMSIPSETVGPLVHSAALGRAEVETLFIGLVRDHHRTIYNYLFRLVGDEPLAEDLTQESYLRAYRGLGKLPAGANHRAWLFRIATNAATDELRRRKRRPRVPLLSSLGLRAPTESEDERLGRVSLDDALLRLPERHRAILNLFEFAEFSAPEVGEVLGISPETARKRRQRAREALSAILKGRAK
jgi:RNA polymerase sigma-70 factor (ECF subfamily)